LHLVCRQPASGRQGAPSLSLTTGAGVPALCGKPSGPIKHGAPSHQQKDCGASDNQIAKYLKTGQAREIGLYRTLDCTHTGDAGLARRRRSVVSTETRWWRPPGNPGGLDPSPPLWPAAILTIDHLESAGPAFGSPGSAMAPSRFAVSVAGRKVVRSRPRRRKSPGKPS
jgi:hypothetical protein